MERLYQFAKKDAKRKIKGQSDLARWLNVSPQVVKNWESRGISKVGAISAQHIFGCDANYITGEGETLYRPDRDHAATRMPATEPDSDWSWPFERVSPVQWNALQHAERQHIEDGVALMVKAQSAQRYDSRDNDKIPALPADPAMRNKLLRMGEKNKAPKTKREGGRHAY
jgi:hypothetical protein